MAVSAKLKGGRELDRELGKLGKRMGRAVMRRVAKKAAAPILEHAARLAPRDTGVLSESVEAKSTLIPRQRKLAKGERDEVNIYVGSQALPHAHLQEFGTANHPPQPFMRPAWEANKRRALVDIKRLLALEIEKAAARAAKKAKAKANV